MSTHVCPWWLGPLLASPVRKLVQDPARILAPHVREGMTVLEPGPGMGFFTIELARRVGPRGRVIAVELQPRMLAGLRRRGVPPEAIRDFVKRIGVAKANSVVDVGMFEFSVREVLNRTAERRMAVLRPLKVVIENYPEGQSEELEAVNHPDDPAAGTRRIRFGRELYIEQDDFMENPPKKFFRLSPGTEVRLRYAYFITCREVVKDAAGQVIALKCTYDPATRGGNSPDGRKVKATIHWVSAADAVKAEVRVYHQLFTRPDPNAGDFTADLNPQSIEVLSDARLEPALALPSNTAPVQFERQGYFCLDPDSKPDHLVFNRTVGLRDTWAKVGGAKVGGAKVAGATP